MSKPTERNWYIIDQQEVANELKKNMKPRKPRPPTKQQLLNTYRNCLKKRTLICDDWAFMIKYFDQLHERLHTEEHINKFILKYRDFYPSFEKNLKRYERYHKKALNKISESLSYSSSSHYNSHDNKSDSSDDFIFC